MALSDVQIEQGQKYLKAWQKCTSRPMAAHHLSFAKAIEAEVRKDDTELIRQLVEALESARVWKCKEIHHMMRESQYTPAILAGRARLEQSC